MIGSNRTKKADSMNQGEPTSEELERSTNPPATGIGSASHTDKSPKSRASSSVIGIYDRPTRRMANQRLILILFVVIIVVLAFLLYQWWL
ncbi:hypothetical protein BH10CHL1_BH10CHL1_26630 [soil metagenome]